MYAIDVELLVFIKSVPCLDCAMSGGVLLNLTPVASIEVQKVFKIG